MRAPTDAEWIRLWEAGQDHDRAERAVRVVSACLPDTESDVLHWPLGRRDRALLDLYARAFSDRIDLVLGCPHCGVDLETTVPVDALLAVAEAPAEVAVEHEGARLQARPVSSADMVAVRGLNPHEARRRLAERVLLHGERDGEPVTVDDLTDATVSAVAAGLEQADPLAEVRMTLVCYDCGGEMSHVLEVVDHVWAAGLRRAQSAMRDVHVLASHYHWNEDTILGMSDSRRAHYLQMVGG